MTKTLPTPLLAAGVVIIALSVLLAFSPMVFAHGGGATGVDPDAPNCMGQLARMHANGKDSGTSPDTQNGFGTNQSHPGFDGPHSSIQDQAVAFQEYCGMH